MNGISEEMAARFYLPRVEDYNHSEMDYYQTFLIQSDYVANKIAEALYLGEELDEDYTDVINARKYARRRINELSSAE